MWCIIISITCEYIFLIINIVFIVKNLCREMKNKDKSKKKVDTLETQVVYKWIRKEALMFDSDAVGTDAVTKSSKNQVVEKIGGSDDRNLLDISVSSSPKKRRRRKVNTVKKKKSRVLQKIKKRDAKSSNIRHEDFSGNGIDFLNNFEADQNNVAPSGLIMTKEGRDLLKQN